MNTLLFQRFCFTKPIILEDLPEGQGDKILALPDRTIIKMDSEAAKKDLPEILSQVKLAEIDPLLVTFFFQKDLNEQEMKYASMFFELCSPLRTAWAYRIMRKYVPDVYKKEIAEILKMWSVIMESPDIPDDRNKLHILGVWAIVYEDPSNNAKLQIICSSEKEKILWDRYIETLQEYIRFEPSVDLYLKLPEITEAPYRVKVIKEEKDRFFEVKTANL